MNLSELIVELAGKAGIDSADQGLIDILSNSDISKVKVSEGLKSKLTEGLLSVQQAVDNHPTIRNKYLAETFNAVDKKLEGIISAIGLSEEEAAEITGIKGTYNRIEKLGEVAKSKLVEAGSKAQPDNEQLKSLKARVDSLNAELANAKKTITDKESEFESRRKADRLEFLKTSHIKSRKSTIDGLGDDVKLSTYNTLLAKKLANDGVKVDFDESGELVLLTSDGSNYVNKDHKKVSFAEMLDQIEAENKLAVVSNPPSTGGGNDKTDLPGRRVELPKPGDIPGSARAMNERIIAAIEATKIA